MSWLIMTIALAGAILNIKKRWECFIFWLVSNTYWCFYNAVAGEYAEAVTFGLFFLLSSYGLCEWSKNETADSK